MSAGIDGQHPMDFLLLASLGLIFRRFYLANLLDGKQHVRLFLEVYVGIEPLLGPTSYCYCKQPVGQGFLPGKILVPHNMSSKPLTWATSLVKTVGLTILEFRQQEPKFSRLLWIGESII